MNRKPLWNYVMIRLDRIKTEFEKKDGDLAKSKGGIYLAPSSQAVSDELRKQEGTETGVIVGLGPSAFKDSGNDLKIGAHVGFKRYAGRDATPSDLEDKLERYRCMSEEDICFFIEE
jgi:co-chaperonin GroES (HSP10)